MTTSPYPRTDLKFESCFLAQLPHGRAFKRLAGFKSSTGRHPEAVAIRRSLCVEQKQSMLLVEEQYARDRPGAFGNNLDHLER